jgi:hypothetical protein
LPESARRRQFTAMLKEDGTLDWQGSRLQFPPGHFPISSAILQGDQFSFNLDVERDPQSDDFHGLWEELGNGTFLTIAGRGSGTIRDGTVSGLLNGTFVFYDGPTAAFGHYCRATDHRFTFTVVSPTTK